MPIHQTDSGYHPPARVSRRSMVRVYVVLLGVTAAFGVLAAYQWERGKAAVTQVAALAGQNAALTQQVKSLESLAQGLADVASVAYEDDPQALLAHLDDMETRAPDAAATEIFVRLWTAAKVRETPNDAPFETANGPEQTQVEMKPDLQADPQIDLKAEPVVQDHAKGDALPSAASSDNAASIDTAVEIAIAAKQESWIQIVDANGAPIFTKLMKPGDQHMVMPAAGATLITGNPTGLALSVDGVTAPAFNAKGPTRRQIALDPQRLLDGTAEQK